MCVLASLRYVRSALRWPMISGTNRTSPRTELFVTGDLLIQGDWKLITGKAKSASWAGPTYPNKSSDGNTLDRYTADCTGPDSMAPNLDGVGPCLYNVGNGPHGDWTEHVNVAAQFPDIVDRMTTRLATLRTSIWSNPDGGLAYQESCLSSKDVWQNLYGNFYGPWCGIGPGPRPAPSPGNWTPTPLTNCTYLPNTWISPPEHRALEGVTTKEACCKACGLDPSCVAGVLQCPKGGSQPCVCNLKSWNSANRLAHNPSATHTDLTCLSGRQVIPDGPDRNPHSEEELLN
jgi:hypothetical protein